jgi:hypothetical protein
VVDAGVAAVVVVPEVLAASVAAVAPLKVR